MWLFLLFSCREVMLSDAEYADGVYFRLQETLNESVTLDGYVDYDALESNREPLDEYVAWLADDQRDLQLLTPANHATVLNAYNMLVLYQVLERDQPESVMDVPSWLPKEGAGFFFTTAFKIGPLTLSLSEIEHEQVRMRYLDYRDHALLNCASMSCPPLSRTLVTRKNRNRRAHTRMNIWVSDRQRGVRIEDGVVVFNPIFEWYKRDFEFTSTGLNLCQVAAKHHHSPSMAATLEELGAQGCPHRFFEYDWRLNDVKNRGSRKANRSVD